MSWLFDLNTTQPIAHAIGLLAFVCVVGMALGSLKFRGIGLGTAGVLFAGILVGHFAEEIDHRCWRRGILPGGLGKIAAKLNIPEGSVFAVLRRAKNNG